jgi:hypothetical protein
MSSTDTVRDEYLGAALRELEIPEHRPEFHRELRRRLEAERRARRTRTRWLPVGAVAAVAAIAVVAIGIPRTHRAPSVATAAVVKAHLRTALVQLRNLSGVLVADGPAQGPGQRWRFTLDAAGDVRLEGPKVGDVTTYDAATGVVRSAQHSASLGGSTLFYAVRSGVAPGPPDQGPPTWILPVELSAYVRAALAAGNPAVQGITYEGRPAWRLDVATIPNQFAPQFSGDDLEITVDKATGMPVRVLERKNGALLRELRLEGLAVDRTLPADTFRLAFPAGADVLTSDDGFHRTTLAQVEAETGYAPLVPANVPAGFTLAQVAVARESAPAGPDGANPPSRMVVSLSYRRGLDQVVVTTRLRGDGTWSDPLASPEGFVDDEQPLAVATGALAGADAHLLVSPQAVPHVWALTGKLVVTIGGDLSRAELVRAAGSLARR